MFFFAPIVAENAEMLFSTRLVSVFLLGLNGSASELPNVTQEERLQHLEEALALVVRALLDLRAMVTASPSRDWPNFFKDDKDLSATINKLIGLLEQLDAAKEP